MRITHRLRRELHKVKGALHNAGRRSSNAEHAPMNAVSASTVGPLLSAQEVAAYLGVPVATLYVWRTRGGGPPAFKVGRHLRYRHDDLQDWLTQRAKGGRP